MDDGKEFYNNTFQDLMKRKGIHHFSASGDSGQCHGTIELDLEEEKYDILL